MILARKRTQRILAFGKRDFTFLSVTDQPIYDPHTKEKILVSGTVSVHTPTLPRKKGYTRAYQDSIAFYKPLRNNTQTHITIVCRIDLNDSSENGSGGFMPMWLYVKTIGVTGNRSVISMRNALVEASRKRNEKRQQQFLRDEQEEPIGSRKERKSAISSWMKKFLLQRQERN